jgi:hypothetical protein
MSLNRFLGCLFLFLQAPKKVREGLYCLIQAVQVFSREGHPNVVRYAKSVFVKNIDKIDVFYFLKSQVEIIMGRGLRGIELRISLSRHVFFDYPVTCLP